VRVQGLGSGVIVSGLGIRDYGVVVSRSLYRVECLVFRLSN